MPIMTYYMGKVSMVIFYLPISMNNYLENQTNYLDVF